MILVMAGCGGGGGGAKPTSDAHPAGVRATPAGAITVSHETAIAAGQPCTLHVHLAGSAPSSVSLWIGGEYDPPASPSVADDLGGGDYRATLDLPASIDADTAAWVRLTMADGSVIEAGRGCFALATLPATP
jgi:hypothetical protein